MLQGTVGTVGEVLGKCIQPKIFFTGKVLEIFYVLYLLYLGRYTTPPRYSYDIENAKNTKN